MTKRYFLLSTSLIMALIWATGCSSFPGMGSSTKTKKVPQNKLYASVPAAMRAPVKEATFDLKKARADLKLANEIVKLAELKKERALLQKKHADYNLAYANTTVKKAEITIERKRLEAIDNANLGDKASNIKQIAKLKTKELDIESDRINTQAELSTLELEIKKLTQKVNRQDARVKGKSGKRK